MTKIRVHEYAKQINKTSKEVIEQLSKLNVQVTNHMSTLEGDAVSKLDSVYKKTSTRQKPASTNVNRSSTRIGLSSNRPQSDRPNLIVHKDQVHKVLAHKVQVLKEVVHKVLVTKETVRKVRSSQGNRPQGSGSPRESPTRQWYSRKPSTSSGYQGNRPQQSNGTQSTGPKAPVGQSRGVTNATTPSRDKTKPVTATSGESRNQEQGAQTKAKKFSVQTVHRVQALDASCWRRKSPSWNW